MQVSVHEAKAKFSELLATVESGGEVVVARHKKPVARMVPAAGLKVARIGGLAGRPFQMGQGFDASSANEVFADDFGVQKA